MIIWEKNCGIKVFWEMVNEILMLMVYEVLCDMLLKDIEIEILIVKLM